MSTNIGKLLDNEGIIGGECVIREEDHTHFHVQFANGEKDKIAKSTFSTDGWRFTDYKQIGGTHYEKMDIQPWEVIRRANLDFWEGNVVKYVMRYKTKNGLEDLKKALHYLNYLIEREDVE